VGAKVVIRDDYLGSHLTDDRDQLDCSIEQVSAPEAVRALIGGRAHHSRITEPARAPEESMVGDAQLDHGVGELLLTVRAEFVVMWSGQVSQVINDDLTFLTPSAGDEGDADPLSGVHRHRGTGGDGLIVRVRMHEK
jgi:hypothetical protein